MPPSNRNVVYELLFGEVPEKLKRRWAVQEKLGRSGMIDALEHVRRVGIAESPLPLKIQQLVHFAQLSVLNQEQAALLHGRAAVRAGATLEELAGVAETALITSGVPGYACALGVLEKLIEEQDGK